MKSGRSSSERGRAPIAAAIFAAALLLAPAARLLAQAIPPPPPNPGEAPKPSPRPSATKPVQIPVVSCPRCGYRCDPAWHYCLSCGWDMTRLVGQAEEQRLQEIARSAMRVVVGGRPNRHGTAFPYAGGYMVTNARHLVGAAEDRVRLSTWDNQEYLATIVGIDLPSGLAVLKTDKPVGADIPLAPTAPVPPESTWAVCYPVVHEGDVVRLIPVSLHRGRLTAVAQSGRNYVSFEDLLRTDHAIEEGCSGGPLIDSRGRLAGMILGKTDDGLTYALPLERLRPVLDSLVKGQRPKWPYYGVGLVPPDDRRRRKFGLDAAADQPVVGYLITGSPAEKAGLLPGDTVTAIAGEPVKTVWDAGSRLLKGSPGGKAVALTVRRAGAEKTIEIAPIERPARVVLEPFDEMEETLEANLRPAAADGGKGHGLVVRDLVRGGRGERGLFHDGDVILSIGSKSVDSRDEVNKVVRTLVPEVFSDSAREDRRFASSYLAKIEVRPEGKDKETREYLSGFPDLLAPPVY
jgi:S1-C subfamily serine protease